MGGLRKFVDKIKPTFSEGGFNLSTKFLNPLIVKPP